MAISDMQLRNKVRTGKMKRETALKRLVKMGAEHTQTYRRILRMTDAPK